MRTADARADAGWPAEARPPRERPPSARSVSSLASHRETGAADGRQGATAPPQATRYGALVAAEAVEASRAADSTKARGRAAPGRAQRRADGDEESVPLRVSGSPFEVSRGGLERRFWRSPLDLRLSSLSDQSIGPMLKRFAQK
eukprot:5824943-Prymnesium_polylepis.1